MAGNATMPVLPPDGAAAALSNGGLVVVVLTILGFFIPMLLVYPPVAPQPSVFLNETHHLVGEEEEDKKSKAGKAGSSKSKQSKPSQDEKKRSGQGCISGLCTYPIQSCRGVRLPRGRMLPTGLEFDRLFAFAQLQTPFPVRVGEEVGKTADLGEKKDDESTWETITDRQFPRLAELHVELWRPDVAKAKAAQTGMRLDYRAEREPTMGVTFVVIRFPWLGKEQGASTAARLWAAAVAKLSRGRHAVPEVEVVLPVIDAATATSTVLLRDHHSHSSARAIDLSAELPPDLRRFLGVSNRLGIFQWSDRPAAPLRLHASSPASSPPADARPHIIVSNVASESWKNVVFRPLVGSETARCGVSRSGSDLLLTPVFPDQPEHTLEVGMEVEVE